jgi:aspartate-semialdehyde dehydrogenase
MSRTINVGIVGATGVVGEVFMQLLQQRNFPVGELRLFASERSAGLKKTFHGKDIPIAELSAGCFQGLDLVFFSSGDDISAEWAPQAVKQGAVAVDNSAAFRSNPDYALVVPEVNGHLLPKAGTPALIANPNCSTIQLVLALAPLREAFGLESVHVATYQAVSGAGKAGQDELKEQTVAWSQGKSAPKAATFPQQIAMNCIPQIGGFDEHGYCSEENKIMRETKKILGDATIKVSAFTVRIPAWNVHSEAVWLRLKSMVTRQQVVDALSRQAGLKVHNEVYFTAKDMDGQDPVGVSRIRQDPDDPQTWLMWVVADNLRKGAALNGIQIAERIFDIVP